MPDNWPGALAVVVTAFFGAWNTWQQHQNNALRRQLNAQGERLAVVESNHRECQEMLGSPLPNDSKLDEFMERIRQVRAAGKLHGHEINFKIAQGIAAKMMRDRPPKPIDGAA